MLKCEKNFFLLFLLDVCVLVFLERSALTCLTFDHVDVMTTLILLFNSTNKYRIKNIKKRKENRIEIFVYPFVIIDRNLLCLFYYFFTVILNSE